MRLLFTWLSLLCLPLAAHVLSQTQVTLSHDSKQWQMELIFDASFAMPEMQEASKSVGSERDWLLQRSASDYAWLREEAEHFLRENIEIHAAGQSIEWTVTFPDFAKNPPDFPNLPSGQGCYRVQIQGSMPLAADVPLLLSMTAEEKPEWFIHDPQTNRHMTINASQVVELCRSGSHATSGELSRSLLWQCLVQGYHHVLPLGLDHVLFVLGLFLMKRSWRALLHQSLAFTLAHSVTLGLAAMGVIRAPSSWVEPLIALSIAAIAIENLWLEKRQHARSRLAVIFFFGLIHGLGFSAALSDWILPGKGFLPSLLMTNLGVELAQTTILGMAWLLTMGVYQRPYYRWIQRGASIAIALMGLYWTIERLS